MHGKNFERDMYTYVTYIHQCTYVFLHGFAHTHTEHTRAQAHTHMRLNSFHSGTCPTIHSLPLRPANHARNLSTTSDKRKIVGKFLRGKVGRGMSRSAALCWRTPHCLPGEARGSIPDFNMRTPSQAFIGNTSKAYINHISSTREACHGLTPCVLCFSRFLCLFSRHILVARSDARTCRVSASPCMHTYSPGKKDPLGSCSQRPHAPKSRYPAPHSWNPAPRACTNGVYTWCPLLAPIALHQGCSPHEHPFVCVDMYVTYVRSYV